MIIERSTKRQQEIYKLCNKVMYDKGYTSDELEGRYIVAIDSIWECDYDDFNYGELCAKLGYDLDLTHVGGWVEERTNTVYIDIVIGLNNLTEATRVGKLCKQIAIYDRIAEDAVFLD
jgi:hypothetical protein